ncbi:hypothetical protein AGLY_003444 [Aphis glycines]|uniref:Uncharacterized protein n=1 Tax=Aphis glycines TaxID=307491 RepID=A0A6G0U022_APHGL|nr:hypothetical protein AGLY_003444 [Aphis glycines]
MVVNLDILTSSFYILDKYNQLSNIWYKHDLLESIALGLNPQIPVIYCFINILNIFFGCCIVSQIEMDNNSCKNKTYLLINIITILIVGNITSKCLIPLNITFPRASDTMPPVLQKAITLSMIALKQFTVMNKNIFVFYHFFYPTIEMKFRRIIYTYSHCINVSNINITKINLFYGYVTCPIAACRLVSSSITSTSYQESQVSMLKLHIFIHLYIISVDGIEERNDFNLYIGYIL